MLYSHMVEIVFCVLHTVSSSSHPTLASGGASGIHCHPAPGENDMLFMNGVQRLIDGILWRVWRPGDGSPLGYY